MVSGLNPHLEIMVQLDWKKINNQRNKKDQEN